MAAVTAQHLDIQSYTNTASSYNTASVSPSANKLILVAVFNNVSSGTPNEPTLSGNGLTWTLVATTVEGTGRVSIFRALSSSAPSAGAITVSCGGQNQNRCSIAVAQFENVKRGGTNGANAVVQSTSGSSSGVNNLTINLSAFGNANNATYGFVRCNHQQNISSGSGFTELGEKNTADGGGNSSIQHQFKNTSDTSVDWTMATTGNNIGRAVEIAISLVPTVTTQDVSSIASTTATGNGNVTSDGEAPITERGVCWNTSGTPTTSDSKATSAGTTGAFTANITGLIPGQKYYVRAYAINEQGTSYGSQVEFTTLALGNFLAFM